MHSDIIKTDFETLPTPLAGLFSVANFLRQKSTILPATKLIAMSEILRIAKTLFISALKSFGSVPFVVSAVHSGHPAPSHD